jgi:hypothetical protein
LGSDGSLTGYAGGIERKQQLLAIEGVKHAWHCAGRSAAHR